MSLKYRDHNGVSRIISGITPGGDIEYGAVATRKGTITCAASSTQSYSQQVITFTEPMPDSDYVIEIQPASGNWEVEQWTCVNKTASGFTFVVHNINHTAPFVATNFYYNAFKIYEVADAEQLYSTVQDLEAMVPANASSTNKFTTADDLRTETRTLDRRLDDVEDVVPTSASITNKLVTQSDLSGVEIDKVEDINDVELTNIQDGQTLIWDDANSQWVNGQGGKIYTAGDGIDISNTDEISAKVNPAQFDFDAGGKMSLNGEYKKTFVGTKAEWDALSASKKTEYTIANITDDVIGGEVADEVTDGLMSPVTSNAVYDALLNYKRIGNVFFENNFLADASTHIATVTHTITIAGTYVIYVNGNPYATDTDMTATIQKNGTNIAFNSTLNSGANNYAGIVSFATEQFNVNDTITIGLTGATQIGTYNHYIIFRIA